MLRIVTCLFVAILVALSGLGVVSQAHANPFLLGNTTDKDRTYQVTGERVDAQGKDAGGYSVTVTVPAGKGGKLGDKDSIVPALEGFELKNNTVMVLAAQGKGASLFFPDATPPVQTASIVGDAAGASSVFSFFDFTTAGYKELNANVPFDFIGFARPGVPILDEAGTSIPITDSNGLLLPSFAFTGTPEVLGAVSSVPEPASVMLGGTAVLLGMGYWWCRRRASA